MRAFVWLRASLVVGVGLAVVAGATVARAAQSPSLACLRTATSTAAMDDCVGAAYKQAERQLALAYAATRAREGLSAGDRAALAQTEKRWLQFRTADCDWAEVLHKGGTLAAVDRGLCLVTDTLDRAAVLRGYAATK
jgi:uncharacterized protein YecT (DUF1311 family)